MGKVFLSFLGLGSFHEEPEQYDYNPTVFILNGLKSQETKFVQVAELETEEIVRLFEKNSMLN